MLTFIWLQRMKKYSNGDKKNPRLDKKKTFSLKRMVLLYVGSQRECQGHRYL